MPTISAPPIAAHQPVPPVGTGQGVQTKANFSALFNLLTGEPELAASMPAAETAQAPATPHVSPQKKKTGESNSPKTTSQKPAGKEITVNPQVLPEGIHVSIAVDIQIPAANRRQGSGTESAEHTSKPAIPVSDTQSSETARVNLSPAPASGGNLAVVLHLKDRSTPDPDISPVLPKVEAKQNPSLTEPPPGDAEWEPLTSQTSSPKQSEPPKSPDVPKSQQAPKSHEDPKSQDVLKAQQPSSATATVQTSNSSAFNESAVAPARITAPTSDHSVQKQDTATTPAPVELKTETNVSIRPQPAKEISLRVEASNSAPVDLKVTERSGKIQVAVRTPDHELAHSIQGDIGELVNRLEKKGFETQAWTPSIRSAETASASPDSRSGSDSMPNQGEGYPAGDQQQKQQHGRGRTRWAERFEIDAPNPDIGETNDN